jgi:hypothetical protein
MPPSPDRSLPVKLTLPQRKALAVVVPEFADRLKLDQPNQRTIAFTREELRVIRKKAGPAAWLAASGMIRNSLQHVVDAAARAIEQSRPPRASRPTGQVYQLKITLRNSYPPIWRRIQVEDCTLDKLHEHIQTAMGWTNSHLHHFRLGDQLYGDPELMQENFDEFDYEDSTRTLLSEVLTEPGRRRRLVYEYDFGDSWEHEVVREKCLPAAAGTRYPLCVAGAQACPPEDVGGVWGFADYVEAIRDPHHERHHELLEWGGDFDPDSFDAEAATRQMRKGLPDWRQWV